MQLPCIDACKTFSALSQTIHYKKLLGNQTPISSSSSRGYGSYPCISCNLDAKSSNWCHNKSTQGTQSGKFKVSSKREKVKAKGKENVWSIDNEMAKAEMEKERTRMRKNAGGKRVRNVNRKGDRIMVSDSMLMEVETVLQTQYSPQSLNLEASSIVH